MNQRQIETTEKYYNFLQDLSKQGGTFSIIQLIRKHGVHEHLSYVLKNKGYIRSNPPYGHILIKDFVPNLKLAIRLARAKYVYTASIRDKEPFLHKSTSKTYLSKLTFAKKWLINQKGKIETNSPIHEMIKEIGSARKFETEFKQSLVSL